MLLVEVVGWLWCGIGVTVLGALAWAGIRNWWRKAQDGLDRLLMDAGFTPEHISGLRAVGEYERGLGRVAIPTAPFRHDDCRCSVVPRMGVETVVRNDPRPVAFDVPTSELSVVEARNLLLPSWEEACEPRPCSAIAGLPLLDPIIYGRVADELALRNRAIERFG